MTTTARTHCQTCGNSYWDDARASGCDDCRNSGLYDLPAAVRAYDNGPTGQTQEDTMFEVIERGTYQREISRTTYDTHREAKEHVDRWIRNYACGKGISPFPSNAPYLIIPELNGAYLETGTPDYRGIHIWPAA